MIKVISSTMLLLSIFIHQTANATAVILPSPAWVNVTSTNTTTGAKFDIAAWHATALTTVNYSSPAVSIWYYNDNVTPQDSTSILGVVEAKFGLTAVQSALMKTVYVADASSKANGSFTSATSFDYLAVHFGHGELLFHWTVPETIFSISNLPRGLSNFRAYSSSSVSPVPEPETYSMMLMGLGLIGFIARRRRNGQV